MDVMSRVRTIPIQRINPVGTPHLSRTSSGESESFPSQKIKMGTSAIKIPIQVSIVSWQKLGTLDCRVLQVQRSQEILTERGAKPPQGIRTVPILRQSVSDSGVVRNMENRQQRSRNSSINSFQEEKCKNEFQDERLQKVHEQLEVSSLIDTF